MVAMVPSRDSTHTLVGTLRQYCNLFLPSVRLEMIKT